MRGVVMHTAGDVRVEEREDPRIIDPTDAVIRVTATCICGSDLWPYVNEMTATRIAGATLSDAHARCADLVRACIPTDCRWP